VALTFLHLFGGFVYLLMGGDLLVRGAVALSRRWRLSPMVVGVTIVALGTSAPELFVSVGAALTGHPGIAMGNVVGSNVANSLLVTGTLVLLVPLAAGAGREQLDASVMIAASLLLVIVAWDGEIGGTAGSILLVGLGLFLVRHIRVGRRHAAPEKPSGERLEWVLGLPSRSWMIVLLIGVGATWLPLGANLLVEAAAEIAGHYGVSEEVIGLSLVALGTSLPELATVVVAAARRQLDVAIGNVIGSNILNILAIMGAAAVFAPQAIEVPPRFFWLDFPVMLASALAIGACVFFDRRMGRRWGIALLTTYGAYLILMFAI
jgi:cation:H+ antiporter